MVVDCVNNAGCKYLLQSKQLGITRALRALSNFLATGPGTQVKLLKIFPDIFFGENSPFF